MNKLKHCSDCSLEEAHQPCEACPNYSYQLQQKEYQKKLEIFNKNKLENFKASTRLEE